MNSDMMFNGTFIVASLGGLIGMLFGFLFDDEIFMAAFLGSLVGLSVGAIAGVLFWGLLGTFDETLVGAFNWAGALFGALFGALIGGVSGGLSGAFIVNLFGDFLLIPLLILLGALAGAGDSVKETLNSNNETEE